MLNTLNEFFNTEYGIRRKTAGSGKVYEIHGIHIFNFGSATAQIYVSDRYIEEQHDDIISPEQSIFGVDFGSDGFATNIVFPKPIRTKHITIGTSTNVAVKAVVYIYVEEVQASKSELIWEFIRRGRNP